MPLRFPRPVMALIAAGTAAVTIGITGMPAAHAAQLRQREWWIRSLGVTGAQATSQGARITVAVLSDGVQPGPAGLAGAVTAAPAPAGAPTASGQYFGEAGTPIASLIAGRGRGTSGFLGVAPAARILSVPVTLPAGDPELSQSGIAAAIPDAIAAGIRYAVRHGATVIDLPVDPGQPDSSGTAGASAAAGGSRAERAAVSYALAHNAVLVAPAGDDGASSDAPNYPAAYRGVIAVGAFNSAFTKALWSSRQSYVTVTAAGAGVLAAASSGGYQTVNSTSAASAVVAGIAALIRARYPGLSVDQVRSAITGSTVFGRTGGRADGSGYGTVNADRAMAAAAALAMPKGSKAGAGAQPLLAPAAIPAAPATQAIGSQLLRAGEISAALLAVLLLLITAYAATGRRRRPASLPAVTAQWAHRQGQSRYPHAATADADGMLDAFITPVSQPDRAGLTSRAEFAGPSFGGTSFAGTSFGSHGSRADDGLFAPATGQFASGAPASPPPVTGAAAEPGALLSHGPATRAVSRRPPVSGAPPWEPASAPHTELPWTAAAGRHSVGGRPAPAALTGGDADQDGPEWQPDEPYGQSLFRAEGQPGGQGDPYRERQPGPRSAENQASAAWNAPGTSPVAAYGALPDPNAAHRGGPGWDGGRWNPAPATGPVIEGSVLSSGPGDRGRPFPASYPGQYSQVADPGEYSQVADPGQHRPPGRPGDPGEFSQRDLDSPADWRRRQTWADDQAGGSQPPSAAGLPSRQPGPDWPGADLPQQPRITPSGLPVRTPRAAGQAAAPLSPSGSLWERADSVPDGYQDASGYQNADGYSGAGPEPSGRPSYGWDPADGPPARGYPPATELPERPGR